MTTAFKKYFKNQKETALIKTIDDKLLKLIQKKEAVTNCNNLSFYILF